MTVVRPSQTVQPVEKVLGRSVWGLAGPGIARFRGAILLRSGQRAWPRGRRGRRSAFFQQAEFFVLIRATWVVRMANGGPVRRSIYIGGLHGLEDGGVSDGCHADASDSRRRS